MFKLGGGVGGGGGGVLIMDSYEHNLKYRLSCPGGKY